LPVRIAVSEGQIAIRFLFNPATGGRFNITGFEDDEYMLGFEMEACARRLSITLP
jgi:hypothetical protein